MSAFSILSQHSPESSSQCSKARKRNKKHGKGKIRKKEIKVTFSGMTVYLENPIESAEKVLETNNQFHQCHRT